MACTNFTIFAALMPHKLLVPGVHQCCMHICSIFPDPMLEHCLQCLLNCGVCAVPYIVVKYLRSAIFGCGFIGLFFFPVLCGKRLMYSCLKQIYASNLFSTCIFVFTQLKVWIWSTLMWKLLSVQDALISVAAWCDNKGGRLHFLALGFSSSKHECRKM